MKEAKGRKEQVKLKGRLQEDYTVFKKFGEYEFELFWCIWGFWEVKQKIREHLYQRKCVLQGYQMPKEYQEARKYVPDLTDEELNLFSESLSSLRKAIPTKNKQYITINESEIDLMVELGCGFVDSILFYHAYKNGCDFFVSRDGVFREKVQDFCKTRKIKIEIISPQIFLQRLQPNVCWECGGKMINDTETTTIYGKNDEAIGQRVISYSECESCKKRITHNDEIYNF